MVYWGVFVNVCLSFFFCFGHGQHSQNRASTLLQVSEFPGAAFMGYLTLSSAFQACEDAVSTKAIGPAVEPCQAQLPAPPGSPSTPSHKISPTSPCPSPFLGHYQSPSPQTPVLLPGSPKPCFVEVIKGSSAGHLHAILMAFDTKPLPYYAVLWGQRPGVYYGMVVTEPLPIGRLHLKAAACPSVKSGAWFSLRKVPMPCLFLHTCEAR